LNIKYKDQGNTVRSTKPKENHSKTLISDEHLDEIIDRQNTKTAKISTPVRKKRSFPKNNFKSVNRC